jgi:cation-transporting P-type ATPase I
MIDTGLDSGTSLKCEVLHSSLGRLRVHLADWPLRRGADLAARLRRVEGVRRVDTNHLTQNVLVVYDPERTTAEALLNVLPDALSAAQMSPPAALNPSGTLRQETIPVPGLDRDPHLGARLVETLQKVLGVRAHVSLLTAQIHVAYDHTRVRLDEIVHAVASLRPPEDTGEDSPRHPLDPNPLRDGLTRVVGAVGAVSVLTLQRLILPNLFSAGVMGTAATIAGVFHLVQGFPAVREGLRKVLGRRTADTFTNATALSSLTVANIPLGLVVAGLEGFLLAEEVTARRGAWRRYEDNIDTSLSALPGAVLRLEAGTRAPRDARVIEGNGTALGAEGQQMRVRPGGRVTGGSLLLGGPFVLELEGAEPAKVGPRPGSRPPSLYEKYMYVAGPIAVGISIFQFLRTGSLPRALETLLLLNPRAAVIGVEGARLLAAGRVLRGGLTVVATRTDRQVSLPGVLLMDGARLLADGIEIEEVVSLQPGLDKDRVLKLAAAVSEAAGGPWGAAFASEAGAESGSFDGLMASARIGTTMYQLRQADIDPDLHPHLTSSLHLELRAESGEGPLGIIHLRPRLTSGMKPLVEACKAYGVELAVLLSDDWAVAHELCRSAGVELIDADAVTAIRDRQARGKVVAVVSDGAQATEAFAACDLAIGLSRGHSGMFPARADLLAPDLLAVADLLEAGARQQKGVRDAILLSSLCNMVGLGLVLSGPLGPGHAPTAVYLTGLVSLAVQFMRQRGGDRPRSALAYLSDPQPERWGRRSIAEALRVFGTSEEGLRPADALARRVPQSGPTNREELLMALRNQIRAPITALLTGGACVTLILGQPLNTALLGLTISMNVVAGVWQERQVGQAAEALRKMSAATARVLRGGRMETVPASDVVLGDVLVLSPGTRVAADARLISSTSLEVAEAALTGESIPVAKAPEDGPAGRRIVLEGSDVVVGRGHAVVVAVGRHTRLGATAAALNFDPAEESPLGARLGQVLRIGLPVSIAGGVLVTLAGLAHGMGTASPMITLGITTALSAIPEGLPLLAGVGQAAVSSRLAKQNVVVRRLAGIEALGRVSVTCSDKTGTLTEGRLSLALVADVASESEYPGTLGEDHRTILRSAAMASPHPDSVAGATHPTDGAVLRAADEVGLGQAARIVREMEVPFDSARAYHVSVIQGQLWVKGAPERVLARCDFAQEGTEPKPLEPERRQAWLNRAAALAERGLRVLAVATGPNNGSPQQPQGLTALGFIGIFDPLRPGVPLAVQRCRSAGVRIIMLTGDHPATARTIAQQAGILDDGGETVTASELVALPDDQLDARMPRVAVIARAAPLDKLRIVESLRRIGHAVAMTGDGVNDAPSLRLADVGVAMGRSGTEVARQAADVVLADDNFASLVEALVEGRGFWRNMRTGLGLLIGGNAGELGLIVGTSMIGLGPPLTAPQILMVNLITDTLPSLAILLQRPEHRELSALAREGLSALDVGLRRDALHRGLATMVPSMAAYLLAHQTGGPAQAGAVGFASVITTQLAQTLDAGRVQGFLSPTVVGAVGGSLALLGTAFVIPPVRSLFGLVFPTAVGWAYVGAASVGATVLSRAINLALSRMGSMNAAEPKPPQ